MKDSTNGPSAATRNSRSSKTDTKDPGRSKEAPPYLFFPVHFGPFPKSGLKLGVRIVYSLCWFYSGRGDHLVRAIPADFAVDLGIGRSTVKTHISTLVEEKYLDPVKENRQGKTARYWCRYNPDSSDWTDYSEKDENEPSEQPGLSAEKAQNEPSKAQIEPSEAQMEPSALTVPLNRGNSTSSPSEKRKNYSPKSDDSGRAKLPLAERAKRAALRSGGKVS